MSAEVCVQKWFGQMERISKKVDMSEVEGTMNSGNQGRGEKMFQSFGT